VGRAAAGGDAGGDRADLGAAADAAADALGARVAHHPLGAHLLGLGRDDLHPGVARHLERPAVLVGDVVAGVHRRVAALVEFRADAPLALGAALARARPAVIDAGAVLAHGQVGLGPLGRLLFDVVHLAVGALLLDRALRLLLVGGAQLELPAVDGHGRPLGARAVLVLDLLGRRVRGVDVAALHAELGRCGGAGLGVTVLVLVGGAPRRA